VVSSTIKAAALFAAGKAAVPISAKVAALADGMMKSMLFTKLKVATALVVVAALSGTAGVIWHTQAAELPVVQQAQDKSTAHNENGNAEEPTLQGTWLIESLEEDGKPSPDKEAIIDVVIKGDKITFNYGELQKAAACTFKVDSSKTPKTVDITPAGEEKSMPGIYELTGDTLKLCWRENLQGGERPVRFTGEGTAMRLAVLKRKRLDAENLRGTWRLIASEFDGVKIGEGRPEIKDSKLVIDKASITLHSKLFHSPNVPLDPEDVKVLGKMTLDAKKNPKEISLTWEKDPWNNKEDFTRRGIYALDGDSLKICLSLDEETKALPSEFSAKFGSKRSLSIFKREPAPKKEPMEQEAKQEGDRKVFDGFITGIGEYKVNDGKVVLKVWEENGKIQWNAALTGLPRDGKNAIGPSQPQIDKASPWFIFPAPGAVIWVYDGNERMVLIKLEAKKQLTAQADLPSGWKGLFEYERNPPKRLLERLPAALRPQPAGGTP
jgi:uncharacterized protein (TIGR03067 family)